jgi:hypothetical protein
MTYYQQYIKPLLEVDTHRQTLITQINNESDSDKQLDLRTVLVNYEIKFIADFMSSARRAKPNKY